MTDRSRFVWILAITAACAEAHSEDGPPADPTGDGSVIGFVAMNDASTPGDAAAATDAGAPLGLYHLPTSDVVNLRIDADGTFRYLLSGGDYGSAELGRWSVEGAQTMLLPKAGRARFTWVGLQGGPIVDKVLVRAGANADELIVVAESSLGREEQSWKRGGMCRRSEPNAVNGSPFSKWPCDDPFGGYDFTFTNGEPPPEAF